METDRSEATALSEADRGNAIRVVFPVDHSKPARGHFSPPSLNCSRLDSAMALEPTIQEERDRLIAGTHGAIVNSRFRCSNHLILL